MSLNANTALSQARLQYYQDPSLPVGDEPPAAIVEAEALRLNRLIAVASAAVAIPRRLGADASREELALDKKYSRQVCWLAATHLKWMQHEFELSAVDTDEVRSAGAQLSWPDWAAAHKLDLEERLVYISTWAIRKDHLKTGNKLVNLLERELADVKRIFGD